MNGRSTKTLEFTISRSTHPWVFSYVRMDWTSSVHRPVYCKIITKQFTEIPMRQSVVTCLICNLKVNAFRCVLAVDLLRSAAKTLKDAILLNDLRSFGYTRKRSASHRQNVISYTEIFGPQSYHT